ncbi:MAG: MvaI/BcnI family restriction endonuclease [Planctomycetota bacterium]|nr:MvaI/BcnI family restriction endonuclease [Planctomycetota bacterium]
MGVFYTLEPAVPAGTEPRRKLLEEVCRISRIGWIRGKRLSANGSTIPCNSTNSGGYTFEAELGIVPNGYSAPDYLGWEIKSFTVSSLTTPRGGPITLMTPEPNGGVYAKQGPEHFVRTYGYPDKAGRPDRINFGGIFRIGKISENTGLRLDLLGFDFERGLLSASDGRLVLVDPDDVVAAPWSFRGLLEHWMRKHAKVAYIPALMENEHGERRYKFGQDIFLGEGTDFNRLLKGLASGHVYYDPGLKVEGASTPHPRMKRRSQIRIRFSHAPSLYNSWTTVDACD